MKTTAGAAVRKHAPSTAAAAVGWLLLLADTFRLLPDGHSRGLVMLGLAVALSATGWLMLCARNRPLAAVYRLGFEDGQRAAEEPVDGPGGGGKVLPFASRGVA
jgi:hypothetical protein